MCSGMCDVFGCVAHERMDVLGSSSAAASCKTRAVAEDAGNIWFLITWGHLVHLDASQVSLRWRHYGRSCHLNQSYFWKKKALAVDRLIINTSLWVFKRRFTVSLQEMKMFSTLRKKERTMGCSKSAFLLPLSKALFCLENLIYDCLLFGPEATISRRQATKGGPRSRQRAFVPARGNKLHKMSGPD